MSNNLPGIWLVIVEGDVEPSMRGPFADEAARDEAAKQHRLTDPQMEDGIFPLDIDANGLPDIGAYSGGFFDGDDEDGT